MSKTSPAYLKQSLTMTNKRYIEALDKLEKRGITADEYQELSVAVEQTNHLFQRALNGTLKPWPRRMKEIRKHRSG